MTSRKLARLAALILCLCLCACAGNQAQPARTHGERAERTENTPLPTQKQAETATAAPATPEPAGTPKPVDYPYLDEYGYYHYQIRLDGVLLPLAHDALLPASGNSYNEILYPFSEILDYFGVAYFWNQETDDFSTVVNGVQVSRDCKDEDFMWFTTQPYGYGNGMTPGNIDGVFYAPNYAFEHTIGAVLTKISKGAERDRAYIDITTAAAYLWGAGSADPFIMRWDGTQYVLDEAIPGSDGEKQFN